MRMSVNLPVPLWQRGIQGDLPLRDIENPPAPSFLKGGVIPSGRSALISMNFGRRKAATMVKLEKKKIQVSENQGGQKGESAPLARMVMISGTSRSRTAVE